MDYTNRDAEMTALLISPSRELARDFSLTIPQSRAFQILADLKSYPTQQALDVKIRQLRPEVILLDLMTNLDTATELIKFATRQDPPIHVVGLHLENDTESILRSLRMGAAEFLHAPFDIATQHEAVARLVRLRKPEAPPEEVAAGRVLSFASTKPGSGASTLATQTAFAIKKLTGKKVLLVDCDLMGGTIGFYLKLSHSYSLLEALQHADHLDPALWISLTVNCGGVDILPAPMVPYSETIESGQLHVVVNYARMLYDWVILDLPSVFQRISLMAVSESDQAFLVSTSELPSLHLARKAVVMLEQLGFPKERFHMIVNRMNKRDDITPGDMEKLFKCKIHASLPNDYFSLHRVVTLGQPLSGEGDLGKAIEHLAGGLAGLNQGTKKSGTGLRDIKPAYSPS
jgi:pilus assembly protein CpaE